MSRYLEVTATEKAFQTRKLLFERNSRRQMLEEITQIHDTDSYQYLIAYSELKIADTVYHAVKGLDFGESL